MIEAGGVRWRRGGRGRRILRYFFVISVLLCFCCLTLVTDVSENMSNPGYFKELETLERPKPKKC